jgi:hypothetical protein
MNTSTCESKLVWDAHVWLILLIERRLVRTAPARGNGGRGRTARTDLLAIDINGAPQQANRQHTTTALSISEIHILLANQQPRTTAGTARSIP